MKFFQNRHKKRVFFVFFFLVVFGCEKKKDIQVDRIAKEQRSFSLQNTKVFQWQENALWIPVRREESTQLAVYLIGEEKDQFLQKLEKMLTLSITLLPGDGGGMKANIDRWKKQLDLKEETKPAIKPFQHAFQPAYWVKIENQNTDSGLVAVIFLFPDKTLFVKIQGNTYTLQKQEKAFLDFISSIRETA